MAPCSCRKDTWQVTTRRVATALGRSPEAEKLVTDVETRIKAAKDANPSFAGRTFTIGPVTGDGTITTISSAQDASALFFAQLGLVLSPKVTSLPQTSIPGRAQISPERLDLLGADVLVPTCTTPGPRADRGVAAVPAAPRRAPQVVRRARP